MNLGKGRTNCKIRFTGISSKQGSMAYMATLQKEKEIGSRFFKKPTTVRRDKETHKQSMVGIP